MIVTLENDTQVLRNADMQLVNAIALDVTEKNLTHPPFGSNIADFMINFSIKIGNQKSFDPTYHINASQLEEYKIISHSLLQCYKSDQLESSKYLDFFDWNYNDRFENIGFYINDHTEIRLSLGIIHRPPYILDNLPFNQRFFLAHLVPDILQRNDYAWNIRAQNGKWKESPELYPITLASIKIIESDTEYRKHIESFFEKIINPDMVGIAKPLVNYKNTGIRKSRVINIHRFKSKNNDS